MYKKIYSKEKYSFDKTKEFYNLKNLSFLKYLLNQ